jgi:hypothetical protein
MEMQELGIWRFLRICRWNSRDWVQDISWEYPSRGKCWISTLVFKSLFLGQYPSFCSFISEQIFFFLTWFFSAVLQKFTRENWISNRYEPLKEMEESLCSCISNSCN